MKKSGLLAVTFLLLTFSTISAQNQELLHKYHLLKGDALLSRDGSELNNISGSPFYHENFTMGLIHFKDHPPHPVKLRYDMVREEMQVQLNDEKYRILQEDIPVEMLGDHFLVFNYRDENKNLLKSYFKILEGYEATNDLMLLEKPYKKIKTDQRSAARGIPPKFVDRSDYYVKLRNSGDAVKVQRKINDVLMFFPMEFRKEMADFIADKKLKTKNEKDLREMVKYYNAISGSPAK